MRLTILVPFLVCLNPVFASKQGFRHQKKERVRNDSCVGVFNQLDVDKDGSLMKSDLATILSAKGLTKKEIEVHLSDVDKHTKMNLAEFCKNEEKKAIHKKKGLEMQQQKTKEQKKQASVQGQIAKDLLLTSSQCRSAFDRLDTDNDGLIQISDIDESLESYYSSDYDSSDLDSLVNRYGSSAYTDYPNFEYYVCYGSSNSYRNDADSSGSSTSYTDYTSYSYDSYDSYDYSDISSDISYRLDSYYDSYDDYSYDSYDDYSYDSYDYDRSYDYSYDRSYDYSYDSYGYTP